MARKISTLKGWTITAISYSAGYYTLTLEKGSRTRRITIDATQVYDTDGIRFENN